MKSNTLYIKTTILSVLLLGGTTFAGNPDRAAQAGAGELLINPWARSSGWGNAGIANARGIEASFNNVAGMAFTSKTEMIFSRTNYLKGADIAINTFGFSQRIGEASVLGLNIMNMSMGDIDITTTNNPDAGIGVYSPSFTNIGVSYAREFSHSIYGGVNIKIISESIYNMSATGVAADAGIQYVTGKRDQVKFGITLKNVGTPMRYSGEGLFTKVTDATSGKSLPYNYRAEQFELPTLMCIGGSYDFELMKVHRLTVAGTFVSNSFYNDQYIGGLEYGFMNYFMVRGGYTYSGKDRITGQYTSVLTGPSGGFTFELPVGKSGFTLGLDYSYRATRTFDGIHSIGAKISL